MQLVIFVIILCSVVSLYALHLLVEDDFVILRKNVTTEQIFNVAISMLFVGLLSARFFYVLYNPRPVFFEILGFLIFPYFPGLSLMGGVVGALAFYLIAAKRLNFPVERVFDFIAKSFVSSAFLGALGIMILSLKFGPLFIFNIVSYLILLFLGIVFSKKAEKWLKDGSIGLLTLLIICAVWIASTFISMGAHPKLLLYKENSIALSLIVLSLVLLIRNEAGRFRRNGR